MNSKSLIFVGKSFPYTLPPKEKKNSIIYKRSGSISICKAFVTVKHHIVQTSLPFRGLTGRALLENRFNHTVQSSLVVVVTFDFEAA